jgi:glucosyl-dolichyl phosphate glucuronosyltransferase
MLITVAVCTWNRSQRLDRTLNAMRFLRIPKDVTIEILVVNNNCTDDTDRVIEQYASLLPVRRVFERELGISRARNASIAEARGELIVWTDDDVVVHPDWIAEYARAAREWPETSFFGGTIEPLFEGSPPQWVTRHGRKLSGPFGYCHYGDDRRPFDSHEFPFAGNMAIRSGSIQGQAFSTLVGRVGPRLIHGEETDLLLRMRRDGHLGIWVPGASIKHVIPPGRQSLLYLWKWTVGFGRTVARIHSRDSQDMLVSLSPAERRAYLAPRLKVLLSLSPTSSLPRWLALLQRAAYITGVFTESISLINGQSCGLGTASPVRGSTG